jgi:hypothetical protein
MKKLLIILVSLSITLIMSAQIELEHNFTPSVKLTQTSLKGTMFYQYQYSDTITNQLKLYGQDYSLYKIITIPRPVGYTTSIYHISDQLFDSDNLIEFICLYYPVREGNLNYPTKIILYNENLNVIKDFGAFNGAPNINIINNLNNGTKLVFDGSDCTKIYSLPGSQPNNVRDLRSAYVRNAFPNPSKTIVNLPYSLQKGEVSIMRIYNLSGKLIDKKQIDSEFDKILLNVDSYQSGTYIYEYNGISKKFIVNEH